MTEPAMTERRHPEAGRPEFAGFWIRAAARILDILVILLVYNLVYLVFRLGADAGLWAPLDQAEYGSREGFSVDKVVFGVFILGFPVFYYVYLHGAWGQTFGKMAFRIRVVNTDGSPISYRKAFLRWLGYFLSGWLTLGLGYLWAAFDDRKQALHDKVCGTLVVRVDRAAESHDQGPPAGIDTGE
jgi:uncharacterized RDD family membrane protein YckC